MRPISFDKYSKEDTKALYKEVKKAMHSESRHHANETSYNESLSGFVDSKNDSPKSKHSPRMPEIKPRLRQNQEKSLESPME